MFVAVTGDCRHSAISSSLDMRVVFDTLDLFCLGEKDFLTGMLVIARRAATDGAMLVVSCAPLVVHRATLCLDVGLVCMCCREGISTGAVLACSVLCSIISFGRDPCRC